MPERSENATLVGEDSDAGAPQGWGHGPGRGQCSLSSGRTSERTLNYRVFAGFPMPLPDLCC